MDLHKLLERQLKKNQLNKQHLPTAMSDWTKLLTAISNAYSEADQTQYMIERSMAISSAELNELNEKLEEAQEIAKIGYWEYNIDTNKFTLSDQLRKFLACECDNGELGLSDLAEFVSPTHVNLVNEKFSQCLESSASFDCELLICNVLNKEYKWYSLLGRAVKKNASDSLFISGVCIDINDRKLAELALQNSQKELTSSARRAGMADVATAILHNVGNILNSANVSVGVVLEQVNLPYVNKLSMLGEMITDNNHNLADYLFHDEKGKLIIQYLIDISLKLQSSNELIKSEIELLQKNMKHIKEITKMQNNLSYITEMPEKISVRELIKDSVKMCEKSIEAHGILITYHGMEDVEILTRKNKLLQIIINLLLNAKDALKEVKDHRKLISILIEQVNSEEISISVKDNGVGIAQDNLVNIFKFGFTTKADGHGYGLHSSALAARELGGLLSVTSDGAYAGARFTVILPLTMKIRDEKNVFYESV
jgi:signal transduction histidine kinase